MRFATGSTQRDGDGIVDELFRVTLGSFLGKRLSFWFGAVLRAIAFPLSPILSFSHRLQTSRFFVTIMVRVIGFAVVAAIVVVFFGAGELTTYQMLARSEEAHQALRDPARTGRVDATLLGQSQSDSVYYVRYSFEVSDDDTVYSSTNAWGQPGENQVSKETYDSLSDRPKTIAVVFLKTNPRIHAVAADVNKPVSAGMHGIGWRLLYAGLVIVELPILAGVWWMFLGTRAGASVVHGSLGCKIASRFVGSSIERTYSLTPLSVEVAARETYPDVKCPLCGEAVPVRVRTWTAARAEGVMAVFGAVATWGLIYGIFAIVNRSFQWIAFPWTMLCFTFGALIAFALGFVWVVNPGFSSLAIVNPAHAASHTTFNKLPQRTGG